MNEVGKSGLRGKVLKVLRTKGFARPVENSLDPGMPDIYYSLEGKQGWIELKMSTTKSISFNIEPGQPIWWKNCISNGGSVVILVYSRVHKSYYIIHNPEITPHVGAKISLGELIESLSL